MGRHLSVRVGPKRIGPLEPPFETIKRYPELVATALIHNQQVSTSVAPGGGLEPGIPHLQMRSDPAPRVQRAHR
jgi:hypothetical protein